DDAIVPLRCPTSKRRAQGRALRSLSSWAESPGRLYVVRLHGRCVYPYEVVRGRPVDMLPWLCVLKVTQEHIDRAFKIARWYGRRARRAEISDLESAALEGLAKAARDWNPDEPPRPNRRAGRKRSFWSFAFIKILGEMRDELRRFDHLTRNQRAQVVEDEGGGLSLMEEGLDWIDPQEPVSLDASFTAENGQDSCALVDLIEEPRDPIEAFELR